MKQKIYNLIDEKSQKGLAANRWINLGNITLIMASVVEEVILSVAQGAVMSVEME